MIEAAGNVTKAPSERFVMRRPFLRQFSPFSRSPPFRRTNRAAAVSTNPFRCRPALPRSTASTSSSASTEKAADPDDPRRPSDSRVWRAQLATLSEHHSVIVADSRGQGRSTSTEDVITYDLMADDYLALLDQLHISQVRWSAGATAASSASTSPSATRSACRASSSRRRTRRRTASSASSPTIRTGRNSSTTTTSRTRSKRSGPTSRTSRRPNSKRSRCRPRSRSASMTRRSAASTRSISPRPFPAPSF